jgi:hypothetical protein
VMAKYRGWSENTIAGCGLTENAEFCWTHAGSNSLR